MDITGYKEHNSSNVLENYTNSLTINHEGIIQQIIAKIRKEQSFTKLLRLKLLVLKLSIAKSTFCY